MIFAAGLNGLGAVKLLQNHHAGQMVRKGHFAHGKLQIGELLESPARCRTTSRSESRRSSGRCPSTCRSVSASCSEDKKPPLRRQHAEKAALRELRADQLRFLLQTLRDLRRRSGPPAGGTPAARCSWKAQYARSRFAYSAGGRRYRSCSFSFPMQMSVIENIKLLQQIQKACPRRTGFWINKLSLLHRAAGRSDGRA